jgi:hypothetical protein
VSLPRGGGKVRLEIIWHEWAACDRHRYAVLTTTPARNDVFIRFASLDLNFLRT